MPSTAAPQATSRLGRYEITGRLATGGMATVYLARLEAAGGFDREFALKVVHPHLADDPGFRRRFLAEATVASRVRHPNAVATIDAGEDQGYNYLVLELIDGVTLRQLMLHRSRPFSAPEAAEIVAMVARGLHALHTVKRPDGASMGVVHRDLSPHNVMIDRSGRAVLIDLGLAKMTEDGETTQIGVLVGKLPYMSPEQARIEKLDPRSDVFALGTVLFELCTGALPFGDGHTMSTFERLQKCDADDIAEQLERHAVPRWLSDVILGCLRAKPKDRFATAAELAEALSQELQHAGYDESALRRELAEIVSASAPHTMKVHPADPLPPRIAAAGARAGHPVRWALVGAAAVLVAALSVQLLGGLDTTTAAERPPGDAASLASDAAEPHPAPEATIPAVRTAGADASQGKARDTEGAGETDTTGDRKAVRRRNRTSRELKPNPYKN